MNLEILKRNLLKLYYKGYTTQDIKQLFTFMKQKIAQRDYRIQPYELKKLLNLNRNQFMKLVMDVLLSGLFEMRWEIECPHCRNVAQSESKLSKLTNEQFCNNCKVPFHSHSDENIVITFFPDPSYFKAMNDIHPGRKKEYIRPLYAVELLSYLPFIETFGDQIPAIEQQLRVRNTTVLFTDLERSTALYREIGDIQAFELVRKHFEVLFDTIINKGGGIIKTIGDAIFAIFPDPELALNTCFTLSSQFQELLKELNLENKTALKMGLATGPALFVNLNNSLDLFGTTINLAARLVGKATRKTLVVSESFIKNRNIQKLVKDKKIHIQEEKTSLKGLEHIGSIYKISLPANKSGNFLKGILELTHEQ